MFVKQARDGYGEALLAREAWFYHLLTSRGFRGSRLDGHLERLVAWDADTCVLVLTGHRGATDLEHDSTTPRYSSAVGTSLGNVLAALHQLPRPDDVDGALTALGPPGRPWAIVSSTRPPGPSPFGRPATAFLDEVRRTDGVVAIADEIAASWSPSALLHGDIRWDNWLRVPPQATGPDLRLIDWETAALGDPRWDVGSALAAYVWSWVRSMPWTAGMDPVAAAQFARQPISIMRPGIEALCTSYVAGCRTTGDEHDLVAACLPFVAARLILFAVDEVIAAGGPSATAAALVQLACNMIQDRAGASHLMLGRSRS